MGGDRCGTAGRISRFPFRRFYAACAPTPRKPARSARVARRQRRRPRARPDVHRGRPRAARQAQADLRSAPRHRRPRRHRQRQEGRADRPARPTASGCAATAATPVASSRRRYGELLARKPEDAIRRTVKGMLPKGPLGRQMLDQAEGLRRPRPPALRRSRPSRSTCPRPEPADPRRTRTDGHTADPDHRPPQARPSPAPACVRAPA